MHKRGIDPKLKRRVRSAFQTGSQGNASGCLGHNVLVLVRAMALCGVISALIGCGGGGTADAGGNNPQVIRTVSVSPTSLSFGNVPINTNSNLSLVVTNTGNASVTISQATTTGGSFSRSGATLPLTLAAGQNTSFTVTFAPTAIGNATGNLSIVSTAADSPSLVPLAATGVNQHSVDLSWVTSTSPNIAGYNVYRGTVSGGPYSGINTSLVMGNAYTDASVQAGETYYYVTTAVNSQGVESAYSGQATAVVPSP
jgi:hypothetical protein